MGNSLKQKFNTISKKIGPSRDTNFPSYAKKANAVWKNNQKDWFNRVKNNYNHSSIQSNPSVEGDNLLTSVMINSSSKEAQSVERLKKTQGKERHLDQSQIKESSFNPFSTPITLTQEGKEIIFCIK